jgi:hypothetical protein
VLTLGTVVATAGAKVYPVSLVGTTTLGNVTHVTTNYIPVTNVLGSTAVGTVIIDAKASVTLIGVSAVGAVSSPLVWEIIDDDQTPNWTGINTGSATWTEIDDTQSPNWLPLAA